MKDPSVLAVSRLCHSLSEIIGSGGRSSADSLGETVLDMGGKRAKGYTSVNG